MTDCIIPTSSIVKPSICVISYCEICNEKIAIPYDEHGFARYPMFCEECRKRIKRVLYPSELRIDVKPPKAEEEWEK